jgi:DNA-binding NarL/FixJ family response regulator
MKDHSRMLVPESSSEKNHGRGKEIISVLLIDDHALVRRGFRRILEDETDIKVVGEAGNAPDGVELARQLKPSVALMDYSLPGMNGLIATGQITRSCPETAVLMLSMHSELSHMRQAASAGARGYIVKDAVGFELVSAIRRVVAGELVFDPQAIAPGGTGIRTRSPLSARELEVLQLIVDGKSNREIAEHLQLSANTVAAHRANIMHTLHLKKTADLVVYALRNGLAGLS